MNNISQTDDRSKQEVEPEEQNNWCQIPHEVWVDNRLNLQEKCLFGRIIALAISTGKCYSGNEYLAKELNKSKARIQAMLSKLEKLGYITRTFTYKKDSKEIDKRYIQPILKTMIPHIENNITPHIENNVDRIDILDKNIDKYNTLSYLEDIPIEDIRDFIKIFNISERQLKEKAEELADYCRAKGKKYKDYRAFLRNAVRKEYGKRKIEKKPWENIPELPDEVRTGNLKKMKEIKEGIGL